jgi:putative thioredoxin
MLEMGQPGATAGAADDLVKDISEATFMEDVIEASKEVPVIVDFWAPWCGPCKTLGPALEAAVTAAGGKVKMVKINVDENQQVSAQLRIQSIPTVYAFHDGQPVDGFQGALPQSQVNEFVGKMAALASEGPLAAALGAAQEMLRRGRARRCRPDLRGDHRGRRQARRRLCRSRRGQAGGERSRQRGSGAERGAGGDFA